MGNWFQKNFRTIIYIAFLVPIITVAIVSISHVTVWYGISNPMSWALYLSIGIEIAALSALAAISAQMGSKVYVPFGIVTLVQFVGNIFFAFEFIKIDAEQFLSWVELTGPILEYIGIEQSDLQSHRRFLAIFAGGMLPLISLSFLHMLVKFNEETDNSKTDDEDGEETKKVIEEESKIKPSEEDLNKLEDILSKFKPEEKPTKGKTIFESRTKEWDDELPPEARGFEPPSKEEDVFDEEPPEWFTEQPPLSDEDEWDEDHELDMVMNDVIKDLTPEEISNIVEESEKEPTPTPNYSFKSFDDIEKELDESLLEIDNTDQKQTKKTVDKYGQLDEYLNQTRSWDDQGAQLPDSVDTAELDLDTGIISTPTPDVKEIDVVLDESDFISDTPELDIDVKVEPSPTETPKPNPNFIVGQPKENLQDPIDPEKKNQ